MKCITLATSVCGLLSEYFLSDYSSLVYEASCLLCTVDKLRLESLVEKIQEKTFALPIPHTFS